MNVSHCLSLPSEALAKAAASDLARAGFDPTLKPGDGADRWLVLASHEVTSEGELEEAAHRLDAIASRRSGRYAGHEVAPAGNDDAGAFGYELDGPAPAPPTASPGVHGPGGPSPSRPPFGNIHPAFKRDRFLLRQKLMALSEKYHVFDEQGAPVLFVHRAGHHGRRILALTAAVVAFFVVAGAFGLVTVVGLTAIVGSGSSGGPPDWVPALALIGALLLGLGAAVGVGVVLSPKRHITFYTDEARSGVVLEIFQDQKLALFNPTYTVATPEGDILAILRKNLIHDLFRKRWQCIGPDGSVGVMIREDSVVMSIVRRLLGQWIVIKTDFIIETAPDQRRLGAFKRKLTLLDKYVLDVSPDEGRLLDRRVALAIGVLLDTGERR